MRSRWSACSRLARVFIALAAMDVGTAFGTLGARREMMVGFLAEPALLMVIFVASLISATTALPTISETLATQAIALYPSLAFTAVAFTMVLLAENARIPVDNPATHLELTMIHEAMLLEYSARHLALMEWAAALKLFNYACIGFALFVPWGIATGEAGPLALLLSIPLLAVKLAVGGSWARADRDAVGEAARVPRAGVPGDRVHVRGARDARSPAARSLTMTAARWDLQLLNLFAALLLLLSFAMLSQRRIVSLVDLLALQGRVLCAATLLLAWRTGQSHLYLSAALTLVLKVVCLPWLLHRLIRRLEVYWDTEPLINIPTDDADRHRARDLLVRSRAADRRAREHATRSTLGIAMAVILLAFLMMITRRKAMSQVIGFLSMENGLFFGAMSATYGMPMVVELGVALDVLVAMLVLGVFFFQIREQFDSLDLHHLESLKERGPSRWSSSLLLAIPLAGALLLASSAGALGAGAQRRAERSARCRGRRADRARHRRGHLLRGREQFFIDPFNVFLVALTAFVGLTTALFSRALHAHRDGARAASPPGACGSTTACISSSWRRCWSRCRPTTWASCGSRWRRRRCRRCCWSRCTARRRASRRLEVLHPLRRRHRAGAVRHDPAVLRGREGPRAPRAVTRCSGRISTPSRRSSSRPCWRSRSCSCWSATAPRSAWRRCTTGCPTRTPRARRRSPRCCRGCCSTSRSTPSCAARCWSRVAAVVVSRAMLMGFGLLSVVLAAFLLWRQRDIKRLFAYSSIEHMGIITFAFGMGGPVANFAALLHMTVHSLTKSAIFFAVGHAAQKAGSQLMDDIRGPDHAEPDDRLGADARHARDPRHAAVRRVRERVPDPHDRDARAAVGDADPARGARRRVRGDLRPGAADGVRRDHRSSACRIARAAPGVRAPRDRAAAGPVHSAVSCGLVSRSRELIG